jgi:hypothetical protein
MNKTETIDAETGEITVTNAPALIAETGMVTALARAEIDTAIATARAYPRSIKVAMDNMLSFATYDEQTAIECIYAISRGGKAIRGASARFSEIAYQQWGNCRVDARVISIDRTNKQVSAIGTFHDLQNNSTIQTVVTRRISDKKGRLFNDDMIAVTGAAACSIARRNAILAGIPKVYWRRAYDAAEQAVAGDIKTLAMRRDGAIKAFAMFGVKPEQIFAALGVEGIDGITLEHIPTLIGMHSAIKNGEETVETMFDPRRTAAQFDVVQNPLKDDAAGPEQAEKAKDTQASSEANGKRE